MLTKIEEAIDELARGNMIIVVDDEDRENEGDLVALAEYATPEVVNFMAKHGRGLICAAAEGWWLEELGLTQMVEKPTDPHGTAFTVSIDARDSTTGISAHERSRTIGLLAAQGTTPGDFRKPGHVFPLAAREGGVLARRGHTEASVDLAKLAHRLSTHARAKQPARAGDREINAAVICEIMNDDGTMSRMPDLERFADKHGLKIVGIEDLVDYVRNAKSSLRRKADTVLPTRRGNFRLVGYANDDGREECVALVRGNVSDGEPVLCRVHSECLTGDAFGSRRCDCGEQLDAAMARVAEEGRGVIVYLKQEGRGIGLVNKLRAYELQDRGHDTVDANIMLGFPADLRNYADAGTVLADLGVREIRLMTNNPDKADGLARSGIRVVERIPLIAEPNETNEKYLSTKRERMGHALNA